MPSTPKIRVERFAKLQSGELIRFEIQGVSSIRLVCDYQDDEPENLLLLLGPNFPNPLSHPTLGKLNLTDVSFESDFLLRLPVDPPSWSEAEPNFDCNCLMVIGDKINSEPTVAPTILGGLSHASSTPELALFRLRADYRAVDMRDRLERQPMRFLGKSSRTSWILGSS